VDTLCTVLLSVYTGQGRNFRPKSGGTATRSVAKPNHGL